MGLTRKDVLKPIGAGAAAAGRMGLGAALPSAEISADSNTGIPDNLLVNNLGPESHLLHRRGLPHARLVTALAVHRGPAAADRRLTT